MRHQRLAEAGAVTSEQREKRGEEKGEGTNPECPKPFITIYTWRGPDPHIHFIVTVTIKFNTSFVWRGQRAGTDQQKS